MFGVPWRLIIVGLLFIGAASVGWFGYQYVKGMQEEIVALRINLQNEQIARQMTETNLRSLQDSTEANNLRISQLNGELAVTRQDILSMERVFRDHDLEKLARAKPGLISRKMQDRTVDVFHQIEVATGE